MAGAAVLSRWQLELSLKCPRCFWLLKRHGIKPPEGYPLALNNAMDRLLKQEFDRYRAEGKTHPLLEANGLRARLFPDALKLKVWRNNREGLRWKDGQSGAVLFGAVDDVLEFPDGKLAVLDYKSSGAAEATVYDSYAFQLDVYTFLLQRLGFETAPHGYIAFFMAVRDDGFNGRLPFTGVLKEVKVRPERVEGVFREALVLAGRDQAPGPGEECDNCRWFDEAGAVLQGGLS